MNTSIITNQRGSWTAAVAMLAAAATLRYVWKQQQRETGKQDKDHKSLSMSKKVNDASEEEKKEAETEGRKLPVPEITLNRNESDSEGDKLRLLSKGIITIVHGSVTGSCAKLANQLEKSLHDRLNKSHSYRIQVGKIDDWDFWDEFLNDEDDSTLSKTDALPKLIIILPTYTSGTWPPTASTLQSTFQELQTDWRIEKFPLKKKIHVAIFGMGSSAYGDKSMGKPAREAQMHLHKLGAKTIVRLAIGDDSVGDHAQTTFNQWTSDLVAQIQRVDKDKINHLSSSTCSGKQKNGGSDDNCCDKKEPEDDNVDESKVDFDSDDEEQKEANVVDLEDMGDAILVPTDNPEDGPPAPPEMVTPSQAEALKKEGYKLIGTHSAVKLCRWTKHQLRGRGGCYKHTFYGITSYQCMEATPSLACANKCVFCWRHHKNPVGKEWRWKTDDPFFIVDEAVKMHIRMINEAKGIPGVRMDRWKEAQTVRHCALSLVGEPIMYPRIDELLGDLHSRKISTFLVTNGQHPQSIENLRPITQLYVSVDAPTQESLIAIDRPLFQDAWDRLKQSLTTLKEKGQRTVARVTVVKGWNSDEVAGYAQLIALGRVSLVEVKGVTFCGKSDASNLNMSNSPWHHEVVELTATLKRELDKLREAGGENSLLPEYGLACEHKHSCSVLLARVDQFACDDPVTGIRKWKTWIDYDKFHDLAMRNAEDASFTFSVKDYVADTPSWALIGSEEEGFDPTDKRHRKKTKYPKYVKFDSNGVPTHDHDNKELSLEERAHLFKLMDERKNEIGCGTTVTEMKDGAKEILDASLMFRGLVVTK